MFGRVGLNVLWQSLSGRFRLVKVLAGSPQLEQLVRKHEGEDEEYIERWYPVEDSEAAGDALEEMRNEGQQMEALLRAAQRGEAG